MAGRPCATAAAVCRVRPDGPEGRPPLAAALAEHIVAVGRDRDRAAFAVLFRHFAPRLKTYFLRYAAVEDAAAEELAQETMLLVWRKAALFDPGRAAASTWVFSVGRNLRTDAWRRERRRGDPAVEEDIQARPDHAPGSDDLLARARREAGLREALRGLPRDQARLVLLAYFGHRSHAEIAAGLGLPLGTVKSRLRAALARLRATLGDAP